MLKLYDSLSRQLRPLRAAAGQPLLYYSCGPTVYDYAHIGNLRAFVFADTIRRALEADGQKVKHVMNITDVGHLASDADEGEDKLEKGAQREGKSVWEVADFYIKSFLDDAQALNLLPPNGYKDKSGLAYPRATDFIQQQIDIVQRLMDKGATYQAEGAVYFDTSKFPGYGQLSGQQLDEKTVGARAEVVVDRQKKNPQDFAVWFFTVGRFAGHTMRWDSPWGEGFPGWHLECSAIIHQTLGEPIDLHSGGVDHIGTHHPNEIAQSETAFGAQLAKHWAHNEFLLVDGHKMSKSLDNFYTLGNLRDKGFSPLALRLLYLQAHYRSQMNFTWEALSAAQKFYHNLKSMADLRFQADNLPRPATIGDDYLEQVKKGVSQAVNDDLGTPAALGHLSDLADKLAGAGGVHPAAHMDQFVQLLEYLDRLLGLGLLNSADITDDQKKLLKNRERARAGNDWELADKIRRQLEDQQIELNDTPAGSAWSRRQY